MGHVRGCGTSTLSTTHEDTAAAAASSRGGEICGPKYEKSPLGLMYIYIFLQRQQQQQEKEQEHVCLVPPSHSFVKVLKYVKHRRNHFI